MNKVKDTPPPQDGTYVLFGRKPDPSGRSLNYCIAAWRTSFHPGTSWRDNFGNDVTGFRPLEDVWPYWQRLPELPDNGA